VALGVIPERNHVVSYEGGTFLIAQLQYGVSWDDAAIFAHRLKPSGAFGGSLLGSPLHSQDPATGTGRDEVSAAHGPWWMHHLL
jgi:hypothetical protein